VLHVAALLSGFAAVLAYTTTSGLLFPGRQPLGLHAFTREEAAALGQGAAFRLDLKRLAFVPITPAWFPDLVLPGFGVLGRAGKAQRQALQESLDEVLRRGGGLVQRMGPLW
jgi:hypothetical protein